MIIESIKFNKEVVVSLNERDLAMLCESLKESNYLELYSDLLIAKDLYRQGYVDNLCLEEVKKTRDSIIKF